MGKRLPRARALLVQNLRRLSEAKGISLNRLADMAPVAQSQLQYVLAGTKDATVGWLGRIADVLDVEVWELLAPEEVREVWARHERATGRRR